MSEVVVLVIVVVTVAVVVALADFFLNPILGFKPMQFPANFDRGCGCKVRKKRLCGFGCP